MSRRVGSMGTIKRPAQWLLAVLLITTCTLPVSSAAGGPEAPTLYLRGTMDPSLHYNFTSEPPQDNVPTPVNPFDVRAATSAEWRWRMNRAPEPWTIEAGTEMTLVVHFGQLDTVLPLPAIPPTDEDPLALRVEARLLRGGTHDTVAYGASPLSHAVLEENGIHAVTIRLVAGNTATYDTTPGQAPDVGLQIELHGVVRRDAPPVILTDAAHTASRITIPGFPLAAYQAWESVEHEKGECRSLLLAQRTCPDAGPAETTTADAVEAPAASASFALIALGLAALARLRRG